MSGKLEQMLRSAKSQRRKLRTVPDEESVLGKLREERSQHKQDEVLVWGPYREGQNKFRLKISEKSVVRNVGFRTREEAETVKGRLLALVEARQERTLGTTIEDFLKYLTETQGNKPVSVLWHKNQLAWLPGDTLLVSLTPEKAALLYREEVHASNRRTGAPIAVATHRARLQAARRLFSWSQKEGFCKHNPFANVQPVGRLNVGKTQLRIDEARRLEAVCLQRARSGDSAAVGALLMMYLGLRQGEVSARTARDIDDNGRVLWVPSGKTKNARRRLKIPEHLRPLVQTLILGKQPDERILFPSNFILHQGYYHRQVKRLCRLAGVTKVCPHSLRGLHATLALAGGATADAVARALGHGSFAMTERHYASESSVADSKSSRVAEALVSEPSSMIELFSLLKELPDHRRLNLLTQLRAQHVPQPTLDDKSQT